MLTLYDRRSLARLLVAVAVMNGCASGGFDDSSGSGHATLEGLELVLAGTETLVAKWTAEDGWLDSTGEAIDTLPASVQSGDALEPLREGGAPASLEARLLGEVAVDIAPREDGDSAEGNPCGEFSVRYFPLDDMTPVIAWPNVSDPDAETDSALFVKRSGDELVQIFGCDRLDIYPEQAGRADIELVLWHVNHADESSDAIGIEVLGRE